VPAVEINGGMNGAEIQLNAKATRNAATRCCSSRPGAGVAGSGREQPRAEDHYRDDADNLALIAPTAMIFVPCERGISHNEAENARAREPGRTALAVTAAIERWL